jgi:precorrin-2 dehydrogenase/sirohydrochlorin ferrochelatase
MTLSRVTGHSPLTSPRAAAAYYPAFLDLRGRTVVVVGGGSVAARKIEGLLPCRPGLLIAVAPEVDPSIEHAARMGLVELRRRPYQASDADGAWLVFGATDDTALNACVAADARSVGALVLAVDDPPNCDLIAPAVVRRGELVVAISTSGRSPAMARLVRETLSRDLPEHWAELLEVAATTREQLRRLSHAVPAERWQAALRAAELETLIKAHALDRAVELLLQILVEDNR